MPVPTFTGLPPFATFEDVKLHLNKLSMELRNLMLNLDSLNVVSLKAETIDTGTLDANLVTIRSDLTSGFIQIDGDGMTANNGSYDTFTVDTNGFVTMTSATIKSASGYPRVEINSSTNLLGAYLDTDDYIEIVPDYLGSPALNFYQGGNLRGRFNTILGYLEIEAISGLGLNATGQNIFINGTAIFDSLSSIFISGVQSLQAYLDAKATSGVSTGGSGSHNHGIPDGTVLMVNGGGTVTFNSVANHTHAQT